MSIRYGANETTNHWHHDAGWLHRGVDYQTDKSVDDAYGALEDSKWDDGQLDTEEVMQYIVSGYDHAQYTHREARQIVHALRLHWDAMTPAAKAMATRFIEEMAARVPNVFDCSPYALAGMPHAWIWPGGSGPRNGTPGAVAMDGLDMSQMLGELAGMVGSEIR